MVGNVTIAAEPTLKAGQNRRSEAEAISWRL
jgi:hypothetical protein